MRAFVASVVLACGCTYPEIQFAPESGAAQDSAPADEGVDANADTTADASVEDTFVADTFVADTFAPDTFVPDTSAPPKDAAPEASDAPTDTPSTGCLGKTHFFCADFDKSTNWYDGFTHGWTTGTGSAGLDPAAGKSPPTALRCSIGTGTASVTAANAVRAFTVASAATIARADVDIRLDSITYGGDATILLKMQKAGGSGVSLSIDGGGLFVETLGTSYKSFPITKTVTAGTWFHVRLEANVRAANATVRVWIDGTQVVDTTTVSTADTDQTARELVVGFYARPPFAAFTARYDNVTLDLLP